MSEKKILYVINHMDWFWSHRLPLARAAQAAGYAVHVAAPGAGADNALTAHGFTPQDLPRLRGGTDITGMIALMRALRGVITREGPGILHAVTLQYALLTGLCALGSGVRRRVFTIAGLGYLFTAPGPRPFLLRTLLWPWLRIALGGARSTLIFQNAHDRDVFARLRLCGRARVSLIPGSGVDLDVFNPHPNTPEETPPLVLMPTRLVREKGVQVFIEAAKMLRQKSVPARFMIAGGLSPSNPRAITQMEMEEWLRGSPVEWPGRVADMPGLLARASVIAYPSHYGEGVPKVLLEAASMAKPIVTTDHPGCRDAVQDGQSGLLVPVRDSAALAAGIEALLRDPARRARMGQSARAMAQAHFDVTKIVAQTIALYD